MFLMYVKHINNNNEYKYKKYQWICIIFFIYIITMKSALEFYCSK